MNTHLSKIVGGSLDNNGKLTIDDPKCLVEFLFDIDSNEHFFSLKITPTQLTKIIAWVDGSFIRHFELHPNHSNSILIEVKPTNHRLTLSFSKWGSPYSMEKVEIAPKQLTPSSASILTCCNYFQNTDHLYSMGNYSSLLTPLIKTLQPKHIVEIGAELGGNSLFLSSLAKELGAKHTLVDINFKFDPQKTLTEHSTSFTGTSIDFLSQKIPTDFYIIDGDHNYSTVTSELNNISKNHIKNNPLCILMHDLGWPCGKRDAFYNPPKNLVGTKQISNYGGPTPYFEGLVDFGICSSPDIFHSTNDNKKENGTLTAVEDFIETDPNNWQFTMIPSLHGLGLLWLEEGLTFAQINFLKSYAAAAETLYPFLSNLEKNRLDLLILNQKNNFIINELKSTIQNLRNQITQK